jgi:hypothetical protein
MSIVGTRRRRNSTATGAAQSAARAALGRSWETMRRATIVRPLVAENAVLEAALRMPR